MYPFLHQLLADKKGGIVFTCFGLWHLLYMTVIFLAIAALLLWLRSKDSAVRRRTVDAALNCSFGLYIADFFLMPFAYGAIDLEKLPFHVCTAMCVLCFVARHNPHLEKLRLPLAVLALASNLIYTVYPAGVGWHQVHPLSYRVVQTLLFHGSMTAYGVLYLACCGQRPSWKKWRQTLPVIVSMTLWAMLGNRLYNGAADGYDHFFNWFFVVQDPFYLLPTNVAPYVMPFVMAAVMAAAAGLVFLGWSLVQKLSKC